MLRKWQLRAVYSADQPHSVLFLDWAGLLMRVAIPIFCVVAAAANAAIVDRTAVTLGTRVITESEILRRIRLTAFQSGNLPDYSDKSRREAAQRLIDLKLVEREMDLGHYTRTDPERAKAMVDAFT